MGDFKFAGTVSAGTLRTSDLIGAFMDVLRELDPDQAGAWSENERIYRNATDGTYDNDPEYYTADEVFALASRADDFLIDLQDKLNELAPDGYRFGAHEGDGADFGFWLVDETVDEHGDPLPRGRCDTCGAPCDDDTGECTSDATHPVALTGDEATCAHCGRRIVKSNVGWIDPEATGDDAMWRVSCDAHDTFTAEHEPSYPRKNAAGETVWACCESSIGPVCQHRALRCEHCGEPIADSPDVDMHPYVHSANGAIYCDDNDEGERATPAGGLS